jgi:gluconolactonase
MAFRKSHAAAIAVLFLSAQAIATEPAADSKPAALAQVKEILRKSGATSAEIARAEEDARESTAEELQYYAVYLRGLSDKARRHVVSNLGYELPYVLTQDSKSQAGVPKGKTFTFALEQSNVFPGTSHTITVYVPAEYTGDKPACVYVGLDALAFEATTVFDNLIFKHEMPVTIAIGLAPGEVPSRDAPRNPRFDRSVEFDSLNDRLARFLVEEVFAEVQRRKTPDGLAIRLSEDPNDRAAGGVSTGGIAAFALAWERPDAFRRVFTASGTFVGMRGGERYPVVVRETEPKPIRIFMQDGAHDGLDDWLGEVGDWWMENQTMERALTFAGYDVKHVWGNGPHASRQADVVFPDAMRWLWRGWPSPVVRGRTSNNLLSEISSPHEEWKPADAEDSDAPVLQENSDGYRAHDFQGRVYETKSADGELWMTDASGKRTLLDRGLHRPTGIAVSPDDLWLVVAESDSHFGMNYRLRADGGVDAGQRFYWFHVPDAEGKAGTANWVFDREGHLFAATALGVQVFDRNGRARAILPLPDLGAAVAIGFGGREASTLYVRSSRQHTFRRKLKIPGTPDGAPPIELPAFSPG